MRHWNSQLGTLLFLCLFFRGALSACTISITEECRNAGFVPGAQVAGQGYDVVTLQPKGAFVIDVNTWRTANGSCTLCDNDLLSDVRQRLPVSLVDWRTLSSCRRSVSSRLYRSAAKLAESTSSSITNDWHADLSVRTPDVSAKVVLAGSHSKMVEFGTSRSQSDHYSFASHQFQCLYYQYRVKEKPLLSPDFQHSISKLPISSVGHDKAHYQKLVATYGTHYLKSVELGGRYKDVTAIRTCEAASEGYTAEEVKDCLSVEASVTVGLTTTVSPGYKRCQEKARSMKHHDNFHEAFSDRETEVMGGRARQGADLLFSGNGMAFARWTDSLLASPGLVRYALAPLHHLLPTGDLRQKNLRRYISEYIMDNALSQKCGADHQCPHGSYRDPRQSCSCLCREDSRVDRNCCSKEKGLGHLVVNIREGRDLWGDVFSATDGYVVVRYGQAQARTKVITNNNNPRWNTKLDLGQVKAESGHKLTIEVWDQNAIKSNDLLGKCQVRLTSGTHSEACYLKYGKVTYAYTFTCGPHLGGATCQDYTPGPGSVPFTSALGGTNRTLLLNTRVRNTRSKSPFPVI
ncbi:perforin-1-like [Hemiscyllium ocellatum]|uniref:perforin-1-like n=1 Tax=Hemiscyllium ocellatum TaxID=170820 RepID=UPI00296775BC|nr:perforin-1-like [Hemiscyllium ocellatum]